MSIAVNAIVTIATVVIVSAIFIWALKLMLRLITPATQSNQRSLPPKSDVKPVPPRIRAPAGRYQISSDLLLNHANGGLNVATRLDEAHQTARAHNSVGSLAQNTTILNPANTSIDTTGVYFGTKFNMMEPRGVLGLGVTRMHE